MEDLFGVIVWIAVIVGAIAKMVGKSKTDNSHKNNGNEGIEAIGKKIESLFSEDASQGNSTQPVTQTQGTSESRRDSLNNSASRDQRQNSDDEWIPAYEQSLGDDRLLQQASGQDKGRDRLEKQSLGDKLGQKREQLGHLELDDEITVRNGVRVKGRSKKRLSKDGNKKREAYDRMKKKGIQLDMESIEKEDLLKGIIFKEIIDEPRAKRPFRPFDRIR
ncbi:MAG: hypothetical protein ACLFPF_00780 [Halanaerobiales bacterium]